VLNTQIAEWQIIFERDPAAHSWFEVMFVYLGLQALVCYRVAHWLYNFRVSLIPRLSHLACFLTGEVIRALFDRIQFLEQEIEQVRTQT
jgi:serine O-acetyltransferase